MTDKTQSGSSVGESFRGRLFLVRDGGLLTLGISAVLIVCLAIGTYIFFRNLAYGDLVAARERNEELQSQSQKLNHQVTEQNVQLGALQAKLTSVQKILEAIMPSANTYNVIPNQSLIVADGRLTLGLVGSPANESVTLIINGKQQTVATGQVINVAPDASANCQVAVQSFDMFKAVVTATCAGAKPQ